MVIRNTPAEFGAVTKTFHWVTAALVLAMFPLGYVASNMAEAIRNGSRTAESQIDLAVFLFSVHKTIGVTVFFVALARIAWAISQTRPGLLNAENRLEAFAAEAVHWSLYTALVMVPATGWIEHAASSGFAPIWWPLGQSLPLVPKSEGVAEFAGSLHFLFQFVFLGSVALHFAGALKHHIIDRDLTLRRMLPGASNAPVPAVHAASIVPAVLALLIWIAVAGYVTVSQGGHVDRKAAVRPVANQSANWAVTEGELAIEVVQLGNVESGKFGDWTAAIVFDEPPSPGRAGSVKVMIAIGSLSLGSVSDQAKGADFFDAGNFPTATFVADLFRTDFGHEARGKLTIKGRELDVVLPFDLELAGQTARMSASLPIDRRDFGVGTQITDEKTLGFEVRIRVSLAASRNLSGGV